MIAIRLTLVLCIGQVSILAATKLVSRDEALYDPLILYQTMLPGTPLTAIEDIPCPYSTDSATIYTPDHCRTTSDEEPFMLIGFNAGDTTIQSITIDTPNLRVGDLPAYWGAPTTPEPIRRISYARWCIGVYAVTAAVETIGGFSVWSPISYIVISLNRREEGAPLWNCAHTSD